MVGTCGIVLQVSEFYPKDSFTLSESECESDAGLLVRVLARLFLQPGFHSKHNLYFELSHGASRAIACSP